MSGDAVQMTAQLECTGTIFNVQRFSVHDGPGIRTTVFLKGCGLHCFWCHNPEGIRSRPEIQFYPERCIGCGECVAVCLQGAHVVQDRGHTFERDTCQACGRCVETCYAGALELTGTVMTTEQVMAEILPDRAFYENSGGGVTLSGGEPLSQPEFTRAILDSCKAEGLHTAVETAANRPWDSLAELLPLVDLVMMDLKHVDVGKHRMATGVSNEQILANAQRLMHTDALVLFRVPVVPTINDTAEDIEAIAAFIRQLVDLRLENNRRTSIAPPPVLELLAFHRLAADKYRSLGLDYRASKLKAPTKEKMEHLKQVAASHGIAVAT